MNKFNVRQLELVIKKKTSYYDSNLFSQDALFVKLMFDGNTQMMSKILESEIKLKIQLSNYESLTSFSTFYTEIKDPSNSGWKTIYFKIDNSSIGYSSKSIINKHLTCKKIEIINVGSQETVLAETNFTKIKELSQNSDPYFTGGSNFTVEDLFGSADNYFNLGKFVKDRTASMLKEYGYSVNALNGSFEILGNDNRYMNVAYGHFVNTQDFLVLSEDRSFSFIKLLTDKEVSINCTHEEYLSYVELLQKEIKKQVLIFNISRKVHIKDMSKESMYGIRKRLAAIISAVQRLDVKIRDKNSHDFTVSQVRDVYKCFMDAATLHAIENQE